MDLIVLKLRIIVVEQGVNDVYPAGALCKELKENIKNNIGYMNLCYTCNNVNEQKQIKDDGGPYAFKCAVGNPRIVFRCSFTHGVDYFPVEFSAEDWPLTRPDIDVPETFIMKYLPAKHDFKDR